MPILSASCGQTEIITIAFEWLLSVRSPVLEATFMAHNFEICINRTLCKVYIVTMNRGNKSAS